MEDNQNDKGKRRKKAEANMAATIKRAPTKAENNAYGAARERLATNNYAMGRDFPLSPTPYVQKSKSFSEASREQKAKNNRDTNAINAINTVISNAKTKKI